MNAEPLVARLWGNLAEMSPTRIEYGMLNPEEFVKKQEAQHDLLELKDYLFMFDREREVKKILDSIEDLIKVGKRPDVVFLDYIQNISSSGKSEYENLTEGVKTLDTFAKKHDIPFIIASQTSNDGERKESSDKVVSYKGSGQIAASGDFGLWLNKEVDYEVHLPETIITVKFKKMRRGVHSKIDLLHQYPSGRIYELSKKQST
jgi:replicative DNA helicase